MSIRRNTAFAFAALPFLSLFVAPLAAHECDPLLEPHCYVPEHRSATTLVDGLSLVDAARGYTVEFAVRYPIGLTTPQPVVIWNHGGSPSARGDLRSAEWGDTLAAAGYVVIHPARKPILDPRPHLAECAQNGVTQPAQCALWITQIRFGPQNTSFLLDHLADIEALIPALAGLLDPERIAIGGHSAGSAVVLANAGATQRFVDRGPLYSTPEPRADAFLASGVQGPSYAGFSTGFVTGDNYEGITKPFLFITGKGDETGEPGESRTAGWLAAVAGSKYLAWDTSHKAVHETMDVHKCDTALRADHCRWIADTGVAFLDAIVRERQEAKDWLAAETIEALSGGAIELHVR
jgi:hypothetical protein